jgi:RNA recognition motif-containing protein
MDARLSVGNLSGKTSEVDLRSLFAQAGAVVSVAMIKDRETGFSTGRAWVKMVTHDDTRKAISMFNGYWLDERAMTVDLARPRWFQAGTRR